MDGGTKTGWANRQNSQQHVALLGFQEALGKVSVMSSVRNTLCLILIICLDKLCAVFFSFQPLLYLKSPYLVKMLTKNVELPQDEAKEEAKSQICADFFHFLDRAVKIWHDRHASDGPTTHTVPYKEAGCWLSLRLPGHANHKPLPFRPTDQEGASRTRTSSAAIQVKQVLGFFELTVNC